MNLFFVADIHSRVLLKYSHVVQDRLALFVVGWNEKNPDNKITSTNIGAFCKKYDKDPSVSLEDIAKKVTFLIRLFGEPKAKHPNPFYVYPPSYD